MNWTEAYLLADMEAEKMMSAEETADRIKQLVAANEAQAAEIERLRGALTTCEKYRDAYDEMGRIGTQAVRDLEDKLAKAVNVIDWALICWDDHNKHGYNMQGDWVSDARATLAELTGGKDE
jgi:hypothetical protein